MIVCQSYDASSKICIVQEMLLFALNLNCKCSLDDITSPRKKTTANGKSLIYFTRGSHTHKKRKKENRAKLPANVA